jgi:hypothetical protein
MAAAYPAEPFKQADSLLTGMIESYRGSTDAADMADIQSLLETTVKIARDREYRVHNNIKGAEQFLVLGARCFCILASLP